MRFSGSNMEKKFEEGRESVQDLPRAGRPKTMVTATNAAHVEEIVMTNRRISIKDISERLNISSGSVHTIIHDQLNMTKVASRWVPKQLTEAQKAGRVSISRVVKNRFLTKNPGFLLGFWVFAPFQALQELRVQSFIS